MSGSRDRRLAELAAAQHNNITRGQLQAAGLKRGAIDAWVARGRLYARHRSVYGLGHPGGTPYTDHMAAVLACGADALVARGAGAHLCGFGPAPNGSIDVIVIGRNVRRRDGITVHRIKDLDARDRTERHGVPVTTPARILLDLAASGTLRDLERAHDEAMFQRVVTRAEIQRVLARYPGARGAGRLAALVADDPPLTQQEAERRFRALVRKANVRQPQGKPWILGYNVDFCWAEHRLIVEIDGFQAHGSRRKFESDRARDARLQAAGYRVVRFTWRQLVYEPAVVVFRLGQLLPTA
jgi:very-short-patch-repair endonuclease